MESKDGIWLVEGDIIIEIIKKIITNYLMFEDDNIKDEELVYALGRIIGGLVVSIICASQSYWR